MSPGRDGPGIRTGGGIVMISPISMVPSPSRMLRDEFGKFRTYGSSGKWRKRRDLEVFRKLGKMPSIKT